LGNPKGTKGKGEGPRQKWAPDTGRRVRSEAERGQVRLSTKGGKKISAPKN